jgi:NitT/TauT family transport system substrate-binding protein
MNMATRVRSVTLRSILAVALGLVSAGCAAKSTPEAAVKTKVGIVSYITFSPLFIAQEEGFFTEQNLDVELQPFESSTMIMPLLEQGQLDAAGDVPVAGLFNAINQTGNIKIVADRGSLTAGGCDYFALLASTEWMAQNPVPTADNVRGKKISVDINSYQAYVTDKYLATLGLTLADMDVQYIPPPNLIEAVKNGAVDFITTAEPWVTRLADTKKMVVLTGYQKIIPGAQAGFLNLGKRFSKDQPELGERFVTAYLKGVRQYMEGKTDRNLEIVAKYTKLPADLLKRICWPDMRMDGSVDLDTVMDYQNWAIGYGQLDKAAPRDAIWDPRFIDYANKKLG